MNLVSLNWSVKKEEGTVSFSKQFKTADPILQIDALGDWIQTLTEMRKILLDNEDPRVKEFLWGE